ncbi:magnesium-transporting ATPase (P-type) [Paenibacillus forsythiae]|uniref:Magnesium-transporting ATPase (P-type) n=1 Tax=Paenibacillus forsythiae TaxID=365616 RepID=A0ABU3H295_9BACL|nr:hypothetical protein [Paenibacillus forsythiae]MDT3424938.1 magnesium-transporting ATPase (P-type) [Paenibacillus forsythiae]
MRKLNEVLMGTGAEIYREIIPLALLSLAGSAVLVPAILLLPVPLTLLLLPLVYMPLLFGSFYAYHRKAEGKKLRIRWMLGGAAKGFMPSVLFGLLLALLGLILWSTWWYYGGRDSLAGRAVAIFQTYFVAMALVSQFYTLQLVIQREMGILKAMGESVKLFFRHPAYTIGAFFQALCVGVMLAVTVVGFFALFTGMLSVYSHKVAYNVLNPDESGEAAQGQGGGEAAYAGQERL